MLFSQIKTHLRQRGEALLSGDTLRVAEDFLYPLPVYMQSNRMVIGSASHAVAIFEHLRSALVGRGVVMLRPSIAAIDLPRAGRFRVWVDWQEIAFPVEASRMSQAVYYCRQTDLGLRTEMLDYTHLSMPELNQRFQALALSA